MGVVVAAAGVTAGLLASVLAGMGNVNRKIVMALTNDSPNTWRSPTLFFESGTADLGLPSEIPPGMALVFGARKTAGPVATGSVGIFTYSIDNGNQPTTVALMWSVPYDYCLYSNWWDLTVRTQTLTASRALFYELYNGDPNSGDSLPVKKTLLGGEWTYEGSMGASGTPELVVKLTRRSS